MFRCLGVQVFRVQGLGFRVLGLGFSVLGLGAHPLIAETMIRHLEEGTAPCFQAVRECRELVEEAGLEVPSWTPG